MYGIRLSRLGWCPSLLLGIVRQTTKTNMQDWWSFTCCFSGSSSKCGQRNSFSIGFTLVDVLQNWLNWLHFPFLDVGLLVTLIDCMIFSVTIPRCYKDVYVKSFFPRTARVWNSLPIECFPLTYDLSGCKSRINRHLLIVGSF